MGDVIAVNHHPTENREFRQWWTQQLKVATKPTTVEYFRNQRLAPVDRST